MARLVRGFTVLKKWWCSIAMCDYQRVTRRGDITHTHIFSWVVTKSWTYHPGIRSTHETRGLIPQMGQMVCGCLWLCMHSTANLLEKQDILSNHFRCVCETWWMMTNVRKKRWQTLIPIPSFTVWLRFYPDPKHCAAMPKAPLSIAHAGLRGCRDMICFGMT